MLRIVRHGEDGLAVADSSQGRGAWLCADSPACLQSAVRRHAFDRAFKRPISEQAISALVSNLGGASEQPTRDVRG